MGWTISSVDGESQQGGFIDAGTSVDAILLQHGSYVFDMTVESGTGTGKYCGSLKLFVQNVMSNFGQLGASFSIPFRIL